MIKIIKNIAKGLTVIVTGIYSLLLIYISTVILSRYLIPGTIDRPLEIIVASLTLIITAAAVILVLAACYIIGKNL